MKNYNIEPMAYNDNSASRPSFYTSTHVVGMKHPGLNLVVWNESNVFYTTNRLCPKQLWKYNFIKKKCNFHSSTKLHFSQEAQPPVFLTWNCTFWNRFGLKKISTVSWNYYFLDVSCLKYTHIQKVSSYQQSGLAKVWEHKDVKLLHRWRSPSVIRRCRRLGGAGHCPRRASDRYGPHVNDT